ncbi:sortase A [Anaerobacterium chartisolvens]|uniref:Sortase A n=1 Tax=Anaerobacterium chartisolvens TaxID=1297424 RepID=A0A369B703_9FIRM|nr:class D sortase [Anaerobacterium chartisolvens]RCX15464.1 sortase A [Anaerobacterium chartisolvens]
MKKVLSVILILAGIGVFLYPYGVERYQDYMRYKLLMSLELEEQTEDSYESWDLGEKTPVHEELGQSIKPIEQNADEEDLRRRQLEKEEANRKKKEEERKKWKEYVDSITEGILTINKIDLRLPIITGASKEHMNISVAGVEGTGKPGEAGNYCIAGHRSHAYGKNFNRLDELEPQDIIEVKCGKQVYRYIVFEKFVVMPEETWVLYKKMDYEKEITLITCTPMYNPTHRIIVKGRLEEDVSESGVKK